MYRIKSIQKTGGLFVVKVCGEGDEAGLEEKRLIAKVTMYGADMGDVRYEIACKTVQEIDPPENPTYVKDKEGTYVKYTDQEKSVAKAKPGYVVESYRVKYEGNTETERTLLYIDTYQPKAERIYVGVTKRGET